MSNAFVFRRWIFLIVFALILGGCARTEPSRFYTLSPLSTSEMKAGVEKGAGDLTIGVGPVTLPDHLDRPQIVTRQSSNVIELAEFDRWAGSLKENFTRVVSENLSILLSTDQIILFPWRPSLKIRYQVAIDVLQLEGALGSSALLTARWAIVQGEDKKVLIMKKSGFTEPVNGETFEALIAAQSRAIDSLSREIATEITSISRK